MNSEISGWVRVRSFFAPPRFADAEQNERARVFHYLAWVTMLVATCFLTAAAIQQPNIRSAATNSIITIDLLCLSLLVLNRLGWTRLASVIFVAGLIVRVFLSAIPAGGITSPGVGAFLSFVLMAEILLGNAAGLVTAFICAAAGLGLVLAERYGALPPPTSVYSGAVRWTLNCIYFGLVIFLSRMASQSIRKALRRAQTELENRRKAEQRLEQAAKAGSIGTWDQDPQTGMFHGDDRAFGLLGLPVPADHALSFADWQALVHPADLPAALAALERLRSGGGQADASYRITRSDGSVRYLEGAATTLLDDQKRLTRIVGMLRDVTEMRVSEEERKRLLYDNRERIKELTALKNTSTLLLDETLDLPAILQGLVDLLPPSFQYPEITEARVRCGQVARATPGFRETPWLLSQPFTLKDGETGSVEVVYLEERPPDAEGPFFREERQLLEVLSKMLQTALERRRAQQSLAASEARYRRIVETSEEGILILDKDGVMTFVNPKLCSLTGYGSQELTGQLARLLLFPEDVSSMTQRLRRVAELGIVVQYDANFRHKSGAAVPVFVVSSALRDEKGALLGTTCMITDMTVRKQLQAELVQTQKIDAMGRLSGGIAHDFNNLLTAILGFAELARLELPETAPARADLAEIEATAKRAASLTRQLLAFSRKQALQPVTLDVNEVVREMQKMLVRIIGDDIVLDSRLEATPLYCRVDRGQLEQVLLNLAVNARDAMPRGGRITVSTDQLRLEGQDATALQLAAGDYLKLTVTDNGIGMSADVQRQIFEPFFTTKPKGQGTGLGLSTVHGIVKQSGGGIRVRSALGAGATFEVLLPRTREIDDADGSDVSGRPESSGAETILIVDDDARIRTSCRRLLSTAGYHVLEADSGRAALAVLSAEPSDVDLLLTDVVMTDMSGFDLATEAHRRHPALRVLYISGYVDRERPADAPGLTLHFLQKPFSAGELVAKIHDVLSHHRTPIAP